MGNVRKRDSHNRTRDLSILNVISPNLISLIAYHKQSFLFLLLHYILKADAAGSGFGRAEKAGGKESQSTGEDAKRHRKSAQEVRGEEGFLGGEAGDQSGQGS